jgi:hypothetical protein
MRLKVSAPIQTSPGAHPASYTMGTVSFPGVKRPGRGVHHPPSSSAEVKERVELYLYSTSGPSSPVLGWTLPFTFTFYEAQSVSGICLWNGSQHPGEPSKQGLVAPQVAVTSLLVGGMAQWLCLVPHTWHRKSLLRGSWITCELRGNWVSHAQELTVTHRLNRLRQ